MISVYIYKERKWPGKLSAALITLNLSNQLFWLFSSFWTNRGNTSTGSESPHPEFGSLLFHGPSWEPSRKILGNKIFILRRWPYTHEYKVPQLVIICPNNISFHAREVLGATLEGTQQDNKVLWGQAVKRKCCPKSIAYNFAHTQKHHTSPTNPCKWLTILITCWLGEADFPILDELVFKTPILTPAKVFGTKFEFLF